MDPSRIPNATPAAMFRTLAANRKLIYTLAKRDVVGRYRGSVVGMGWSFFNPLLMLMVYTFVFSVVFQARWGEMEQDSRGAFAVVLFVGVLVHGLFAECINRAPTTIVGSINYVKKVVFPLEILPAVSLASALFHSTITLGVLLVAQLIVLGFVPWTAVLLPVVLLPLMLLCLGLGWMLSGLAVYLRDIAQFTGILTMAMMFMAPVFYPVSALPENIRPWLYLNPLTFIIEQSRAVLLWGQLPDWIGLGKHFGVSLLVAWAGFAIFQKLRRGFADVV